MLGALGIFVYVGAEVAIGSFLVELLQGACHRRPDRVGGRHLFALLLGRRHGRPLHRQRRPARMFRPGRLLAGHALVAAALVMATMLADGHVAMWRDAAGRLLQRDHVPHHLHAGHRRARQAHRPGLRHLVMAIVGGAVHPGRWQGALADRVGIHHCFVIPAPCYAYIAWYGAKWRPPVRATVVAPGVATGAAVGPLVSA